VAAARSQALFQRPPVRGAKAGDAVLGVVATTDFSLGEAAGTELLDHVQEHVQLGRIHPQALLFQLHPAGRSPRWIDGGTEDDVLLAGDGDDGQARKLGGQEQILHTALIAFAQGQPSLGGNEVTVVAHPLRLIFADDALQQSGALVEGEHAGRADVRRRGRSALIVIHEGGLDESGPRLPAGQRLAADQAQALRLCQIVEDRGAGGEI